MIRDTAFDRRPLNAYDGPLDTLLPAGVHLAPDGLVLRGDDRPGPSDGVVDGVVVEEASAAEPSTLEELLQQPGWEERDSRCLLLRRVFALPRPQLTLEAMEALLRHLDLKPTALLLPPPTLEGSSVESNLDGFMTPTLIDRLRVLGMAELARELYSRYRDTINDAERWVAARALCAAIREGSPQEVQAWVVAGAPLSGYQGLGGPLAAVFRKDDPQMLQLLLDLGLPLEGSGEEEWVAFVGNAGPLRCPLLQAVTSCAWRCASLLLHHGARMDHIEEIGLWFGSLLARYAAQRDVEIWMSRRDSSGSWLIPWDLAGGESWICTLLRRGGPLGLDACDNEDEETLLERLNLVERLAALRGEDLATHVCPIHGESPLGVVARVAIAPEEVQRARQIFGAGSQRAAPGRLALAIWCERILHSRHIELSAAWMLEPECLRAWLPGLAQEHLELVRGESCALALAIDGDLDPVLECLEQQGLPLVCREGPGLLRALQGRKMERAERWIEQHVRDPEWAAELLVAWSQFEASHAQSGLPASAHSRWGLPHVTHPGISHLQAGPLAAAARSPYHWTTPPAFSPLRDSLLRSAAHLASGPAQVAGAAHFYCEHPDPWSSVRRCVLTLVRLAGQALNDRRNQTPMAVLVWRAFGVGREELAHALLQQTSPWACDPHGLSLWSLWICLARDDERVALQQWRSSAPARPSCPETGLSEGVSLLATLLQLRAEGVDCPRELEAMAWKQLHAQRSGSSKHVLVEQLNALRCPQGRSLLHLASQGPASFLYALVNLGLDVWRRDDTGWALGFYALEKQREGLLEACLRQGPPAAAELEALLRTPTPCFTPIALQLLKRAGADLTLLDGEGQDLVGRMLRVGRLDSLRWLLAEGLSRNPGQTSSLQANPLCQMRLLSVEGVRELLSLEPAWATTACPVLRCLPLQQAMLVDPVRSLAMLHLVPTLAAGHPMALVEQALRGRWSDQDLVELIQLLRAQTPLDGSALEALLRAHRKTFLLVPLGESVLAPLASDLQPAVRALQESWQPLERVGRDWVIPFPATLVVLPTCTLSDEQSMRELSRRAAEQARAFVPITTPHHPSRCTPNSWLHEALILPPDVRGEQWLWERLQKEMLAWLSPWAPSPCTGIWEAHCWAELLQGLSEQAPEWPLQLSALRLSKQLTSCRNLQAFLAVASALCTQRVCQRTLRASRLSGGQKVSMIQRWAQVGLVPPQGALELLHTPRVLDQERMHLFGSVRKRLGKQAIADELFLIFCDAPEGVLREVLARRGQRVPRRPRMLHEENVSHILRLLVSIHELLLQGGWPPLFLEDLCYAMPTFWARARRLDSDMQPISVGTVMVGAYFSWVAGRIDLAPLREQLTQMGSLLLILAHELEGVLTHWTGETVLQLLQLQIADRQQLRRTITRVLTSAEDLYNLRMATLTEMGQLAVHENRLYQGPADLWVLDYLDSHLPEGWEMGDRRACPGIILRDQPAPPG